MFVVVVAVVVVVVVVVVEGHHCVVVVAMPMPPYPNVAPVSPSCKWWIDPRTDHAKQSFSGYSPTRISESVNIVATARILLD